MDSALVVYVLMGRPSSCFCVMRLKGFEISPFNIEEVLMQEQICSTALMHSSVIDLCRSQLLHKKYSKHYSIIE